MWRYHALYLYQRSYESGGRVWETFFALWVWVSPPAAWRPTAGAAACAASWRAVRHLTSLWFHLPPKQVMFTFTLFSAIVLLSKTMYTAGLVRRGLLLPGALLLLHAPVCAAAARRRRRESEPQAER